MVHGVPQPTIEWLKDGKPIPPPSKAESGSTFIVQTTPISADQISSVLEIKSFRPEHEGLVIACWQIRSFLLFKIFPTYSTPQLLQMNVA